MVFEESLTGDLSEKLEVIARPLVGMRSSSTEDWWSYPLVIVYLAIDTSMEGRNGILV